VTGDRWWVFWGLCDVHCQAWRVVVARLGVCEGEVVVVVVVVAFLRRGIETGSAAMIETTQ
jgi:hypothetical protein